MRARITKRLGWHSASRIEVGSALLIELLTPRASSSRIVDLGIERPLSSTRIDSGKNTSDITRLSRVGFMEGSRLWVSLDIRRRHIEHVGFSCVGTPTSTSTRSTIVRVALAVAIVLAWRQTAIARVLITSEIRTAPREVVATAHQAAR
jgi:hypothetical protein